MELNSDNPILDSKEQRRCSFTPLFPTNLHSRQRCQLCSERPYRRDPENSKNTTITQSEWPNSHHNTPTLYNTTNTTVETSSLHSQPQPATASHSQPQPASQPATASHSQPVRHSQPVSQPVSQPQSATASHSQPVRHSQPQSASQPPINGYTQISFNYFLPYMVTLQWSPAEYVSKKFTNRQDSRGVKNCLNCISSHRVIEQFLLQSFLRVPLLEFNQTNH